MRDQILIKKLIKRIQASPLEKINIMEVCGTHTKAISKLGIRELFEPKCTFMSGPGCPVCVTSASYIDWAIEILNNEKVILVTFGDLIRVKGSKESILQQRIKGKKIKVVYSPLDALKIARENIDFQVVFLAVGFETTAPLVALAIKEAKERNINNLSFLTSLKTMPPVLHKILKDKQHQVQGIICPGHVAVIKGADYFKFITEQYQVPAVVAGFKALDILAALYFLTENNKDKSFQNIYKSCVSQEGNKIANEIIEEVFSFSDAVWRGIGTIKNSAYCIENRYDFYDAINRFNLNVKEESSEACSCSEILLGKKIPSNCALFGDKCTPESPWGPCMVSDEGACNVFYKYNRRKQI